MKLIIKKATTSKIIQVFIQDASKSDGSGLTGLVYNSASLTAYYIKVGDASPTAITLATATVGTWTSSGFKEVDATNMPGVYEIGIPNACLTIVEQVVIMLKGATNMAPVVLEIQLRDNTEKDIYDRIGAPAGASISADLLAIDNFVDELESRLTAVRAGYIDNLSVGAVALASVCTEIRLAELDAANLPTDVSTRAPANEYDTQMGYIPSDLTDVPTAAELIAAHGAGSWEGTTPADVADAVWDEDLTGHTTSKSAGWFVQKIKSIVDAILAMVT